MKVSINVDIKQIQKLKTSGTCERRMEKTTRCLHLRPLKRGDDRPTGTSGCLRASLSFLSTSRFVGFVTFNAFSADLLLTRLKVVQWKRSHVCPTWIYSRPKNDLKWVHLYNFKGFNYDFTQMLNIHMFYICEFWRFDW